MPHCVPSPAALQKANKIYAQTEKAAQGVLVRASSYMARKASQEPATGVPVQGDATTAAHASSMNSR